MKKTTLQAVDWEKAKKEVEEKVKKEVQERTGTFLEGSLLHHRGAVYDLKDYTGQQFRQVGKATIYEFLQGGRSAYSFVVSGTSEATEIETEANKWFRGY